MNSTLRRMITNRGRRDYGDYTHEDMRRREYDRNRDYGMGEYEVRGRYENDYDYGMDGRRMRRDYDYEETDGRRGVKGTGRYGIGGSRYYGRDRDMRDYEMDGRGYDRGYDRNYDMGYDRGYDYASSDEMRLTREDMERWKKMLRNADGTQGEHFTASQVKQAAESLGIRMEGYTEADLCMTANMLYSDIGEAFRAYIPREKEAHAYVKAAKLWLDDPDASVHGSEKLAGYFMCFVDDK